MAEGPQGEHKEPLLGDDAAPPPEDDDEELVVGPNEASPEDDAEAEAEAARRRKRTSLAYTLIAWLLVACFGATTLTLALVFPVKKHKFTRVSCVSHAEAVALTVDGLRLAAPYVAEAGCGAARAACDTARQLDAATLRRHCGDDADCVAAIDLIDQAASWGVVPPLHDDDDAASMPIPGPLDAVMSLRSSRSGFSFLGDALLPHVERAVRRARCDQGGRDAACADHDYDDVALALNLLPAFSSLDAAANGSALVACAASAACDAAQQYVKSPARFCANSTATHRQRCTKLETLVDEVEIQVAASCREQGGLFEEACGILNVSLHDRGYWAAYCDDGVLHRAKCEAVINVANAAVDEKVCSKSPQYAELCDAARAIARRYANASASLPFYEAFRAVASIHCAEGVCDAAPGDLSTRERFENGSFAHELHDLEARVPELCNAWPLTRDICANVTRDLDLFCAAHPLLCEWLAQLQHFNATRAEDLFVATWRAADAACAARDSDAEEDSPAADALFLATDRRRHRRRQHLLRSTRDTGRRLTTTTLPTTTRPPAWTDALFGGIAFLDLNVDQIADDACKAVDAIDAVAADCPEMLPAIAAASSEVEK